ncbi:wings apart [Fusarium austroafricanum]|uniref:Wings apart n=1 Tax=Fusarium austroafricanum TaxID=2364996 RepID=A0A8H4PAR4_9HYPO|nr:wings apart [Fusarium austroafricanum]
MASRNGPAAPVQRKLVTYGKSSRKTFMRDAMPLRTTGPFTAPSNRPDSAETVTKPSKSSLPRSTSDPSPRPPVDDRSDDTSRAKARDEQKAESRDATDSRKRKRQQAAHTEPIDEEPTSSPSKQIKSTTKLPQRPLAGTSGSNDTPAAPRRSPLTKKSPKDTTVRSRPLPRSKSDISTSKPSSSAALLMSKDHDDDTPRPKKRRPRLIDALAAQRADSPDSDDSDPEVEDSKPPSSLNSGTDSGVATPSQQSQNNSQNHSQDSTIWPRRTPVAVKGRRVKYTYGQSRSVLSESSSKLSEPSMETRMQTKEEAMDALLATPPEPINPDPFAMDSDNDLDEDGDIRPAIKSVHELRRAGANNRFADEMEDLLARIGTPGSSSSSLRRSALLELSQKLQRKEFISQFRDHATRDKVAANIGQEQDIISGFGLSAVLVTFLHFNPAAHLLQQLVDDGLGQLLSVLLRAPEDIDELASGKLRLAKTTRNSVSEVKTMLIKMNIWHGRRPEKLSPQTLALQLLNIVCQRIDAIHSSRVVRDVENDLENVIGHCVSTNPRTDAVTALIISILESQSGLAMNDENEVSWVAQQTHHVARILENSLQQWPEKLGDIETATLKLSINMSNTTHGAAAFSDILVLSGLSKCILLGFKSALDALSNRRLKEETYDGLLLVLGMAINILEHCAPARENITGEQLNGLVTVYLQNQALMREADSVEKSKLSVAFGYLSVLLGYLALEDSTRQQLAAQAGSSGLLDLIGSIKEFIGMYRSVDKVTELEGLVNDLQRLQRQ